MIYDQEERKGEAGVLLVVTDRALAEMAAYIQRAGTVASFVRIEATPSAPIRSRYSLDLTDASQVTKADTVMVLSGVSIVVSHDTARLIEGTRIDYVSGLWGAGFDFLNPNNALLMKDHTAVAIDEVLRDEVNPGLGLHEGSVHLVDMVDGNVYLQFRGRCQGCNLAPQTLKMSVDRSLRARFPEIRSIVDITDHPSGLNPYYQEGIVAQ